MVNPFRHHLRAGLILAAAGARLVPDGYILRVYLADTILVNPLDNDLFLIGKLLHVNFVLFKKFPQGAKHRMPSKQNKCQLISDHKVVLPPVADSIFPDALR
jgi:hypothetical protein